MKYVLVDKTRVGLCSVDYYRMLGYEVCTKSKGLDLMSGSVTRAPGETLEVMGMVLMQIPLDDWADLEQNGMSGTTGQKHADDVEARIRDRQADIREVTQGARMRSASGAKYFEVTEDVDR